jgi:hypothetical protein
MGQQGFTRGARASRGLGMMREPMSLCWCVLHVLSSVLGHATTGKQCSIDQVVTGRRSIAVRGPPEIATALCDLFFD